MEKKNAWNILEKAGLKKTSGRIAILNCLLKENKPLSQHEIAEKLKGFKINEASIYRSLEAFHRVGIVHKVEGVEKTRRFAISESPSEKSPCHPHFICIECGKVECLKELEIPDLKPHNKSYVVKSREMILKGSCKHCSS